jgi:O-methyltransferase
MTDPLYAYVLAVGLREPEVCRRLREHTATLPDGDWQSAPEQGPVLELLIKMLAAERVLEIGTFTGYGTLWMALSLPPGGRITTCDVESAFPEVGRPFWIEAGVADRIELILGPALESMATMPVAAFDLVYIDADKAHAPAYYERALALVRPGGIVAIDNTLWDGKPADPAVMDASTVGIRTLNAHLTTDARVDLCFLPFADGMTLARKR